MTDTLLQWMSFRMSGRREDLPSDLLVGEPPMRVLSDLAALGHVEDGADGTWRIAPPVLAALADETGNVPMAVLCGARTPKVLERLKAACVQVGTTFRETPQEKRPSIIAVAGTSHADLAATAAEAGIPAQRDAAFTLLACLPAIREWPRTECPMVAGRVREVKRFSRSRLAWQPASLDEAAQASRGFFRIRRDWDWVNMLKQSSDSQVQIEFRAGRLAAAERAKVVRWDAASRSLRLPQALYPPTLIARALVLCSGALPAADRDRRELIFQNVPVRTTRMVLAITGLRLA